MKYALLIIVGLLAGCEHSISHEAIQDAYATCHYHDGLKSITVDSDDWRAVCTDGKAYVASKYQQNQKR